MIHQPRQRRELPPTTPLGAMVQILLMRRTVQMLIQAIQLVEQPMAEITLVGVVLGVEGAVRGGGPGVV